MEGTGRGKGAGRVSRRLTCLSWGEPAREAGTPAHESYGALTFDLELAAPNLTPRESLTLDFFSHSQKKEVVQSKGMSLLLGPQSPGQESQVLGVALPGGASRASQL